MARQTRVILALIGLLLVGISIAALVYAFAPGNVLREAAPLAPTLFTLPAGGVP